jgi:hypothetical protein
MASGPIRQVLTASDCHAGRVHLQRTAILAAAHPHTLSMSAALAKHCYIKQYIMIYQSYGMECAYILSTLLTLPPGLQP